MWAIALLVILHADRTKSFNSLGKAKMDCCSNVSASLRR